MQRHHFRSGCGPLDAFQEAQILLDHKDCDVVLVEGIDLLKSEGRIERQKLMNIYGEISIPEAYTELAFCYLDRKGYKVSDLEKFSQVLFENFAGTDLLGNILGKDFGGVLVSDCLAIYDDATALQQKCYAHHHKAIRKAKDLHPQQGEGFLCQVAAMLRAAVALQEQKAELSLETF